MQYGCTDFKTFWFLQLMIFRNLFETSNFQDCSKNYVCFIVFIHVYVIEHAVVITALYGTSHCCIGDLVNISKTCFLNDA